MARHAGILLPLFSATSSRSWGVGDFGDVPFVAMWLQEAGCDRWMLLPIGTIARGETSPYSASSAMALDPMFIAMDMVEDFTAAGGAAALPDDTRALLDAVRASDRIAYDTVRHVKQAALALACDRFVRDDWNAVTPRGSALAGYIARERWWLDDHALFQAISARMNGRPWTSWPAPLAGRDAHALDDIRRQLSRDVLREQYTQWIAEGQWHAARAAARERGVALFGDVPFMVNGDSADVWARPNEFLANATAGAPPDAYSATGQDWGLPVYDWPVIVASDFAWLRQRARRMAALFDGVRIDHVVGFFRTYARPAYGEPFFIPSDVPSQIAQGTAVMRVFLESGAAVLAEDLGIIPDFVRASLTDLGIAGYRVLRWERRWSEPGQPFIDPRTYPALSVAATGTHDTEPMAAWWDEAGAEDRHALAAVPPAPADIKTSAPFSPGRRDHILTTMYASGSDELFVPVPDLFGWRDRINTPATVGAVNWTWRLPWAVDRMGQNAECVERATFCRWLAEGSGRVRSGQ